MIDQFGFSKQLLDYGSKELVWDVSMLNAPEQYAEIISEGIETTEKELIAHMKFHGLSSLTTQQATGASDPNFTDDARKSDEKFQGNSEVPFENVSTDKSLFKWLFSILFIFFYIKKLRIFSNFLFDYRDSFYALIIWIFSNY